MTSRVLTICRSSRIGKTFLILPIRDLTCRWQVVVAMGFALHAGFAEALEFEEIFKRPDQRAAEMLENGEHEAAANNFEDPQWRGISRYRAGFYEEAMKDFATVGDAKGLYNHGTAAARAGDYAQAVASLEQALQLAPQDTDIAHNLDIARKLNDLAENQQQDQQQDNGGDQQQESETDENNQEDNESGQRDESSAQQQDDASDEQQGEQNPQSEADSQQSGEQESGDSQQNNGEMHAEENNQSSPEQQQSAEDLREMMQQEQAEAEQAQPQQAEQQVAASAADSVSEDDQATEQWLRRIPDDASQLLRNKIRLNHLIEFPEVHDMQEPW